MENPTPLIEKATAALNQYLEKAALVNPEALQTANNMLAEKLKEYTRGPAPNLLSYLTQELKALEEDTLLETSPFPLISLSSFDMPLPNLMGLDLATYEATWTIPFDKENDYVLLATTYAFSKPVIEFWSSLLKERILWYTTSLQDLQEALEQLAKKEALESSTSN